jgi:transcription initiation factor TFIID TATA-box-binding protein
MEYKIVNIIASTNIGEILDLNKISRSLQNIEYEPEIYFALIFRINKPKLSILVNKSGIIIFAGAKSFEDINAAKKIFFNELHSIGYHPTDNKIIIQNLVILSRVRHRLDFHNVISLKKTSGLINNHNNQKIVIKNFEPKFTAMVFKSGKILIVGLKDETMIDHCLQIIEDIIK